MTARERRRARARTRIGLLAPLVMLAMIGCAEKRGRPPEIDASHVPLPDDTAGKACKRDFDCATGRCATALQLRPDSAALPAPGGYCTAECDDDSKCGGGGECIVAGGAATGECLGNCKADRDCRAGYRCVGQTRLIGGELKGTCQPKPETGQLADGVIGQACERDSDCGGGFCASTTPLGGVLPGNYCSGRCLKDSECGAGGVCLTFEGSAAAGSCYRRCGSDTDCARAGYRCRSLGPGVQGCYPAPAALADHTAGKACETNSDCGDSPNATCATQIASLVSDEMLDMPGGYCTQRCSLDAECGAGAQCIAVGLGGGTCLATCQAKTDCREGYACLPHTRDLNDDSVCVSAQQAGAAML